jgi:hypothetical protein
MRELKLIIKYEGGKELECVMLDASIRLKYVLKEPDVTIYTAFLGPCVVKIIKQGQRLFIYLSVAYY